jgi:putative Mg2+ transporter-C (MgtC) family protein
MVVLDIGAWETILRLIISAFLGALIGLEREMSHRPAGLRTHMLVSVGSCLFTLVSIYSFSLDPARVAASIVTGIGFIGAGSIIAGRGHVQGLTTAASLWVVAGVGLAAGAGSYFLASVASIVIFLILQLKRVERRLEK